MLSRVVRREHLKLLHGVLRDLRGDASAAGVLVVILLSGIAAVDQEGIAARDATEREESEGSVVGNARCEQDE